MHSRLSILGEKCKVRVKTSFKSLLQKQTFTIATKKTYHVYVIELSKRVWKENRKFREANPQFNGVLQCLYVGMTSQTPKQRFEKHKSGHRNKKGYKVSANIVEKYGLYLRPSLYEHLNPMTKDEAIAMEKDLALQLKKQRYAVWWNWILVAG